MGVILFIAGLVLSTILFIINLVLDIVLSILGIKDKSDNGGRGTRK